MDDSKQTNAPIQSLGGKARAEKLPPEDRSEIARVAAQARWDKDATEKDKPRFPKATHEGVLKTGGIPCFVLEDGTRVLSRIGFLRALGRKGKAKGGRRYDEEFKTPVFLTATNLKPFIQKELIDNSTPVIFRPKTGGPAYGYKADLLPMVCEVFIDAKDAGELLPIQEHIYEQCKILLRGLARVGITALVDEATGYQEVRDRLALQKILEAFITKELAAWAKRFPDEFYQELFRLRNWQWQGMSVKRPILVGKLTNDLVYDRLAPGILDELRKKNPIVGTGYRKHRHHQWLTEDVGHPALAQHLHATIAFMRASKDWLSFHRMMDKAFPKKNDTMQLALDGD